MTPPIAPRAFASLIMLAALLFASGATGQVYKCKQADGGTVYQDSPCKGGTIVDVRAGSADPTAVDRLERANAEFNRAAAVRGANEAMAAQTRDAVYQQERAAEEAQRMAEAAASPAVIYVPTYVAPSLRKHRFDGHRRVEHRPATSRSSPSKHRPLPR